MNSTLKTILLLLFAMSAGRATAQLHFEEPTHDFGTIAEEGGVVEHTFTAKNSSKQPIVIVSTSVSCGCTKTEFLRKPILPDSTVAVKVIFSPLNYPGAFARKVVVVTSEGIAPQQLLIKGHVTPRPKSIEERYPIVLGGGIRIATNAHHFAYIEHDKRTQSTFDIVNTSKRRVTLNIECHNPLLHFSLPRSLAPGEEATINFGYSLPSGCNIYGTLSDKAYLTIDGVAAQYPLIVGGVAIDSRNDYADNVEPSIAVSKNFIKFGALNSTSPTQSQGLFIENTGEEPLIIRALELERESFSVRIDGASTIAKGEKRFLTIEAHPSKLPYGAVVDKLRIVSNDPTHPMTTIRISAVVER